MPDKIEAKPQQTLQEHLKYLRVLRPIDDIFMRCMFKDNLPLIQFALRIILNRPDLALTHCETQKDLKRLVGLRSLELDIYADEVRVYLDEKGNKKLFIIKYNLETERSEDRMEPHRLRYHVSAIDVESLKQGQDFKELPECYVIFITETDYFGAGKPVYTIERTILECKNRLFGDGEHILYVNAAYRGDDDIGKLMHDFCCSDPDEMLLEPMAERARYLKQNDKGVKEMSKVYEEILSKGDERGTVRTRLSDLKMLMEKLGYTVQQAMDLLEVPPELRLKLEPQLNA